MTPGFAELSDRLAALRVRLMDTGARAGQAAAALARGVPPDAGLIDELRAVAPAVAELRAAVLGYAADAGIGTSDGLATAADLEHLVAAIAETEAHHTRQTAWNETRGALLVILQRVVSLVHREEAAFGPLAACQATARAMAASLPADVPPDVESEVQRLAGLAQPFADLAMLADAWNALDDARCARLQESIAQAFGRPLAFAALRGKLGRAGEPAPARAAGPAPRPAARAAPPVAPPPAPPLEAPAVMAASVAATPPIDVPAIPHPAGPPLPPTSASPSPAPAMPPPSLLPPVMPAMPATPSLAEEVRLAASAESAPAREQRRAALERLAKDTAPWWIAARAGWSAMRKAGQSVEAAAPRLIDRFPYLLGVPLPASAQRGVAEGYALLLAHVEQQEPGFVDEALLRLNLQLTGQRSDEHAALGPALYAYVVAEGRLYKTYPDFVKTVIAAVLPKPGVWLQGWLVEEANRTLITTRPDGPAGADVEERRELRSPNERFTTHRWSATLAPLTARVFRLEASSSLDPATDVEVLVAANGTPSADAWVVTAPMGGGAPAAPRRHKVAGTPLALGGEVGAAWLAVFNPDPNAERRYDLTLGLQRKTSAPPIGGRRTSTFGKKPR